jgi:hypothetical protein
LGLISSGTSKDDSEFVDAGADGNNVFFATRQQLVRADNDGSADLYDARVQGGILSQNIASPAPCEGDDCQGPAKAVPSLSLPASLTFSGSGNAQPPVAKSSTKAKGRAITRGEKLARALKACRPKTKRKRAACERQARKSYGLKGSAKHVSRRAGR